VFCNAEPSAAIKLDAEENRLVIFEMFSASSESRPRKPIPLGDGAPRSAAAPLAVTWLGHATALVEIDGYRLLTDPVWSQRCSPSKTIGPQRLHPPPVDLEVLPALDAVVISHDHYDHLDMDTVRMLARTQRAVFVTPLAVGAHLRAWGIPASRIVELDWGDGYSIDDLTLTCTPARHFSGRFLSRNNTLWSSWVFAGPQHRLYFGGDTGYTDGFADIGGRHGPFDLTLLPIGAYNKSWPDIHMNPEEAIAAHRDLNAGAPGGVLVPIHWCTFRLAPHPWAEPADRLVEAALDAAVEIAVPKPGGRVVPTAYVQSAATVERWWRQ
jgi:L-ascorbate metabolism protein UlaG (beta-lactamase superfamily)